MGSFALSIALLPERFDQGRVFAVAQRFRAQINVERADMRHSVIVEEQPRDGAANDNEFAAIASQNLADLDEHRLYRLGCAVRIVGRRLRIGSYCGHCNFS